MSTAKKPVTTQTEELRFLPDFFGTGSDTRVEKLFTPELVTTATTAITNFLTVAVLLGWLNNTDVETLTKSVTALVGAISVIVVNSTLIWKFIAGRFVVKAKMLEMKYQYAQQVAVERLRAGK